jgi:hypothetical protein
MLIVTTSLMVAMVASSSFLFSALSPAHSTHFLLTVEILSMYTAVNVCLGGVCLLLDSLFTHCAFYARENTQRFLYSKIRNDSMPYNQTRIVGRLSGAFADAVKQAADASAADAAKQAADAAKQAADASAADTAKQAADAADAADAPASAADAKEGEGCSTQCSTPDMSPSFEEKKADGPEDATDDAASGASTV